MTIHVHDSIFLSFEYFFLFFKRNGIREMLAQESGLNGKYCLFWAAPLQCISAYLDISSVFKPLMALFTGTYMRRLMKFIERYPTWRDQMIVMVISCNL